ncbi:MAG: threonine--tRNA ligase, partial [Candidatus Parcubacteria bacterium]|nr:threonine--tRNA ligase [Candidatus Parcubacteria bacterium]
MYKSGDFIDLCAGPHIKNTDEINSDAFKLTHIAGAYWRGSEKNAMLTRIYGLAFETKKELDDYIKLQTEAEKRDHRKIGRDLELFIIDETVGQGLPLWLPKGAIMRQVMEDFVLKEYLKNGYQLVRTPHIGSEKLFCISGHLDFYKESMYAPVEIENEKYYLKPMNCPMHIRIYQNSPKSYRDLPVRYTELGTVYRYEKSGVLHGLVRVRGFTQDDGHILCREDQVEEEIFRAVKLTKHILESFGFENFKVALSVRDPKNKKKYLGSDKDWKKSEEALIRGIKEAGWNYEREEGEAVFYGPKMDIKIMDAIGREWQISTLQVDFNLPKKFDVFYTDKDGKKKQVFMLHRALLGSLERFTG